MTHRPLTALLICTLPGLSAAQATEPPARPIDGKARIAAREAGIGWLVRHQEENGAWSASQFQRHDPKTDLCTGTGKPEQDLLATAWATMALLRQGNAARSGPHAGAVQKALQWIEKQMQSDGFVGAPEAANAVVAHAFLCVVLLEDKMISGQPPPKQSLERLAALCLPDGTWPARLGGTKGDPIATCFAGIASQTYNGMLRPGDRVDLEPTLAAVEKGTLATAWPPSVEVTLRFLAWHVPKTDARLAERIGELGDHPPQWRDGADATRMDFLDWYLGTFALSLAGGDVWSRWCLAAGGALIVHQRTDGAHAGSWDPVDARGKEGGRVYATAVNVCCLSVGERFGRIGKR